MDSLDNVEYMLAFQRHFVVEFDDEWLQSDRRGVTYGDLMMAAGLAESQ